MYVTTAYLIKPKPELLGALQADAGEIIELFVAPQLILREKERYIFGNVTAEQWSEERMLEVKTRFVTFTKRDLSEVALQLLQRALGSLDDIEAHPGAFFDRWWTMERIEEVCSFESLDPSFWNKSDEQELA